MPYESHENNNAFVTDRRNQQHKSTKMVSRSALQNRCLHTTSTDRSKNILTAPQVWRQLPIIIQRSVVWEKWSHSSIRTLR